MGGLAGRGSVGWWWCGESGGREPKDEKDENKLLLSAKPMSVGVTS